MGALLKIFFTSIILAIFFNSYTFANNNWKTGDYFCEDPNSKITITPNYYERINFNLNDKGYVKILDGTLGVVNGIDKGVRTQNKKASFSKNRRKFGFILEKKNTDGTSTHIVRFMHGDQLQISSKKSILPNQWTANCIFTKQKSASAAVNECGTNPKACITADLCKITTFLQSGKKIWKTESKIDHVKEAKARGLTCGVKKINNIKLAFISFDTQDKIKIQTTLTDLKHYSSGIDGDFGPSTEKALKRYLKENNLSTASKAEVIVELENLLIENSKTDEIVITSNNLPIGNVSSSYLFAKVIHIKSNYISVTENKHEEVCKNISTPVKTCKDEQVPVYGQVKQNNDAVANALIGAIMGGIAGNAVTDDNAGTSMGALMGGLIGSSMSSNNNSNNSNQIVGYQTVKNCKTVTKQERSCKTESNKVTSRKLKNYKLTYDFHGKLGKIFTQNSYKVGDKIPLTVNIAAQILIDDVENFLKIGAGTFGLEFTKKYSSIRELKNGSWNAKLENDLNDFQSYVYQNQDFRKYADSQKTLREESFNNAMGDNRQELTALTDSLRTWLQTNLIHEKANQVFDLVTAAEDALEGTDLIIIRETTENLLKVSRELNLTQKFKSFEELNNAERKITEAVFGNYDASGRMAIQKALGDKGLFNLSINGEYGTGVHLAIKAYMKINGYKKIETVKSLEEQLTILVPTSADVNTLSVIKNKMSAEEQWKKAVLLIQDIEDFIVINPTAFDFEFIKKYKPVRDLENSLWDADQKSKFEALKKYVLRNESFKPYANKKEAERKAILIDQLETLRMAVGKKETQLSKWLQTNLIDPEADNVLTGLQEIQSAINGQSLLKLASALKLSENLIETLGLIDNVVLEKNPDTKFDPKALYFYVNLTEKAKNVFRNLKSNLELETGFAEICQVGNIDQWTEFVSLKKLKELIKLDSSNIVKGKSCSNSEDFYIVAGSSLISGEIPKDILLQKLTKLYVLERGEAVEYKRSYMMMADENYDAVMSETVEGYGLFYIRDHPTKMCSSVNKNIEAHNKILKNNNDIIRFFAPSKEAPEYDLSVEELNKRLQRKKCGAVYASAGDLKVLTEAIVNGNIYEIQYLPIWINKEDIATALEKINEEQKTTNAMLDKTEEEISLNKEKQKQLRELELKKSQEASRMQQRLQEKHLIKFSSLIDRIHPTLGHMANKIFNVSDGKNYQVDFELDNLIHPIMNELKDKELEGWEIISDEMVKVDYGTARFKGRKLEAVVVDFIIYLKNREVGSFENYCKKIHITYDLDFDMWRKELFGGCSDTEKTYQWMGRNDFESGWIVIAN